MKHVIPWLSMGILFLDKAADWTKIGGPGGGRSA